MSEVPLYVWPQRGPRRSPLCNREAHAFLASLASASAPAFVFPALGFPKSPANASPTLSNPPTGNPRAPRFRGCRVQDSGCRV